MRHLAVVTGLVVALCGSRDASAAFELRVDVPAGQELFLDGQVPGMLYSITCPAGGPRPSPAEIRSGTCPGRGTTVVAPAADPDGVIPLRWSPQSMAARRAELLCRSFRVDPATVPSRRILVEAVDNWSIWCDFSR